MSGALVGLVFRSRIPGLTLHAKSVLVRIADLCDAAGNPLQCLSQKGLAGDLQYSVPTFKRYRKALEPYGLIILAPCGPERFHRNGYGINVEKLLTYVAVEKRFGNYKNWGSEPLGANELLVQPQAGDRSPVNHHGSNHEPTYTFNTNNTFNKQNRSAKNGKASDKFANRDKFESIGASFDRDSQAKRDEVIIKATVFWLVTGKSFDEGHAVPDQKNFKASPAATTAARYALWALKGTVSATGGSSGQRVSDIADALNGPNGGEVRKRCQQLIEACGLEMPRKLS